MAKEFYQQVNRILQTGISSVQSAVQQQYTGGSNFYPSTLDIQSSMKSGWLQKQGGVVKSWHRRWFTIKGDYMYYYATVDEVKAPLGVIFLPGSRVVEHPFNANEPGKFVFEIVPETRTNATHDTYPIAAENEEERKEWIKIIKQVLYASIGGAIFGRPLEDILRFEMVRDPKRKIPEVLELCAEFLLKRGINEEGIFRLPGRSVLIKQMCDAFDRGEQPQIDVPEMDVHTAASIFKGYLRDLPGPLVPVEFYEPVMRAVTREMPVNRERALDRLSQLMRNIPVANYNVLQFVCQFLRKVADRSERNKMTATNLATVFVQAFVRPDDDDPALLMATASTRTMATLVLIADVERVFNVEYTSDGSAVVVGELLRFGDDDIDSEFDPEFAGNPGINSDLLGLEFMGGNGTGINSTPVFMRPNAAKVSSEARAARAAASLLQLAAFNEEAEDDEEDVATTTTKTENRRGAVFVRRSLSGDSVNDDGGQQRRSSSPSEEDRRVVTATERPPTCVRSASCKVKRPVPPPRPAHQKQQLLEEMTESLKSLQLTTPAPETGKSLLRTSSVKVGKSLPPLPAKSGKSFSAESGKSLPAESVKSLPAEIGNLLPVESGNSVTAENGKSLPVKTEKSSPRTSPPKSVKSSPAEENGGRFCDDASAVETLTNLDTTSFSSDELRTHVERLCLELTVRQQIIDDLNARTRSTAERHRHQIDALVRKMDCARSASAAALEKCSSVLRAYVEKYGPVD